MRPGEHEFGLRLAAKAADREKAAGLEWPAFEERLRKLGYGPRAIAHAFRTLSGPGTVAEALEVLRAPKPESHLTTLSFEVTETRGRTESRSRLSSATTSGSASTTTSSRRLDSVLTDLEARPRTILAMTTTISAAISGLLEADGAAGLRCRYLRRRQPCFASGSRGTRLAHRSGRDQRSKSASRFRIDRDAIAGQCVPHALNGPSLAVLR